MKGVVGVTKRGGFYNVEPLRTLKDIEEMKLAIKRGNKITPKRSALAERDLLIFLIGINTGLRVNDLVRIKVSDVQDCHTFMIREGKTKKIREVNVSMLENEIQTYLEGKYMSKYLFPSQKKRGINPLSTTQVYRILNDAADFLGRKDIGTHTMRKTFGYHHYKQFKDIAILQEIFNHSAPSITMRYIGINKDDINKTLTEFRLG